jgi:transcriptional regulator with XRE-family HTH domain
MDGKRLHHWRESRNLTRTELARVLGVPYATIVRWEEGKMTIRHGTMLSWALDGIDAALRFADLRDGLRMRGRGAGDGDDS